MISWLATSGESRSQGLKFARNWGHKKHLKNAQFPEMDFEKGSSLPLSRSLCLSAIGWQRSAWLCWFLLTIFSDPPFASRHNIRTPPTHSRTRNSPVPTPSPHLGPTPTGSSSSSDSYTHGHGSALLLPYPPHVSSTDGPGSAQVSCGGRQPGPRRHRHGRAQPIHLCFCVARFTEGLYKQRCSMHS